MTISLLINIIAQRNCTHDIESPQLPLRKDRLLLALLTGTIPIRRCIGVMAILQEEQHGSSEMTSPKYIFKTFSTLEQHLFQNFTIVSAILLFLNFLFSLLVIHRVPYTEIDWKAYMQEVSGVLNDKQLDYIHLRGDTGPLVYPAGFVYIYSALYYITDHGSNISRAQYIFAALHSLTLGFVLYIYYRAYKDARPTSHAFPLWIIAYLFISRRIMSLFVLRLFNDCVQTLLIYISLYYMIQNRWRIGCLFFSLSVSVKMNALLYAPGLAILLVQSQGFLGFLQHISLICLPVQLLLAAPFLFHAPKSYLSRAFELTRVFLYKWSVNGAMLPERIFLDWRLSVLLLSCHLFFLLFFAYTKWTARQFGNMFHLQHLPTPQKWLSLLLTAHKPTVLPAHHIVSVMLTSNFIGIAFARTIHYQFYVWYAHTIPLLIWTGNLPLPLKLSIPLAIELVFNIYPPHAKAATALHVAHALIFISLLHAPPTIQPHPEHDTKPRAKEE